jgi:uncharacterized protein (DUF427 family)
MTQKQEVPYWAEFIPSPRWVRAKIGTEIIADSKRVMLLRETGNLPTYYFPKEDVRTDLLQSSNKSVEDVRKGIAKYWTVKVGDRVAENAAWNYETLTPDAPDLKGYMAFEWEAMDAWFEEDDQIYRHARDPYKRIDVVNSSRHVQIIVGGEIVADTRRPRLLFETGLPIRYYIPKEDVRMEWLIPSDTKTQCPYKGIASYYSVKVGEKVHKDLVWYYPFPIPECPKIENLVCFYNERVDALIVNGEQEEKVPTPWSQ